MSVDTLRTMTRKLLRLSLPASQFCWQGGEPTLMGLDWFQTAIKFQMQFGHSGQICSNSLQTNALLIDDDWAEFLARYKFLVGVSLDGPREIHDLYRGEGTHERVMHATDILDRHKVEFNTLAVVSRANQDLGRQSYRWFRDNGFDFMQFIPAIETDENNKPLPFSPTPAGFGQFMCDVFDAWIEDDGPGKVYVRLFESTLCQLAGVQVGSCIMGTRCSHYMVVEHNGDVFPCDFFVRADLKIGNITEQDIPELANSPIVEEFASAKGRWNEDCDACRFLTLCHGGCLKDRERAHGHFNDKTYLCPSYKKFYSHTFDWFKQTADRIMARQKKSQRPSDATSPRGR